LRALAVHDPDAVRQFLDEHDATLGARVKREVRNKLDTGLKNPKRTGRHAVRGAPCEKRCLTPLPRRMP